MGYYMHEFEGIMKAGEKFDLIVRDDNFNSSVKQEFTVTLFGE